LEWGRWWNFFQIEGMAPVFKDNENNLQKQMTTDQHKVLKGFRRYCPALQLFLHLTV